MPRRIRDYYTEPFGDDDHNRREFHVSSSVRLHDGQNMVCAGTVETDCCSPHVFVGSPSCCWRVNVLFRPGSQVRQKSIFILRPSTSEVLARPRGG
jgi:hypothetical protein